MTRTPKQLRQHALRESRRRMHKARRKECRACAQPVARTSTGRPMRLCERHLAADATRKRAAR